MKSRPHKSSDFPLCRELNAIILITAMNKSPRFAGVIFDMDGTLTIPTIDFKAVRRELGVVEGVDLIEAQRGLDPGERARFWAVIERHELAACGNPTFQAGVRDALRRFEDAGVRLAVMTRNSRKSADAVLSRIGVRFDPILTREFEPVKPAPEPAHHILRTWGVAAKEVLVVGDYRDDLLCGRAAGCATCFFHNDGATSYADLADHVVSSFGELSKVVFS